MSRLQTMARFDEEIPEERVGGFCVNCNEPLYEGQEVVKFDNELFCDVECFKQHMDVREETL